MSAALVAFDLAALASRAARTLSAGQRRRVALARVHRGIALGVYGPARALPPRVALGGHLGQFPHVDDRRVAKLLT